MAVSKANLQSSRDRNIVNTAMRATPEWRNAITSLGLNPDGPLKLNKTQQQYLAQTLGVPTDDFHIDQAGNINDYHGWKGLPTWAKTAIVSGAAIGTAGAAGAFGGAGGAASAVGGTTTASTAGGLGTLGTIGTGLKTAMPFLGAASRAVGGATKAAGANRARENEMAMEAARDYETQFGNRADLEATQRRQAAADVYRKGWYAANPQVGPSTTGGARPSVPWSENYMSSLNALEQEGLKRLEKPSQYDIADQPRLERFKPRGPSKLERIGGIAAPVLSTIDVIGGLRAPRRHPGIDESSEGYL